ncbi:hypothetical protein ACH5RR_028001 [Cinchona calisaya]|uniref:B box-type domain-containing protein n=1 Tax=Cinchona calisaya TaxID=153742 RepID=A0ABD2YRH2_9GENT
MDKGRCELCSKAAARMYCESDEARLCWECDEKVHSANFLVAKHSRSLLCHLCQSPTPWKASGTKLPPTISLCESCFLHHHHHHHHTSSSNAADQNQATARMTMIGRTHRQQQQQQQGETDSSHGDHYSSTNESESDDTDFDEEDEEEDGENQVVPWSSCSTSSSASSSAHPPLTTSNSSSSDQQGYFSSPIRDGGVVVSSALNLKRSRADHLDSDDEDVCCSSEAKLNAKDAILEDSRRRACMRTMKMARAENETELRRRRMEILGSVMSFQQTTAGGEHDDASDVIRRISKLSRDAPNF